MITFDPHFISVVAPFSIWTTATLVLFAFNPIMHKPTLVKIIRIKINIFVNIESSFQLIRNTLTSFENLTLLNSVNNCNRQPKYLPLFLYLCSSDGIKSTVSLLFLNYCVFWEKKVSVNKLYYIGGEHRDRVEWIVL